MKKKCTCDTNETVRIKVLTMMQKGPRARFVKTVGLGVVAGSSTPAARRVDGPSPHITTIPFSLNFIMCLQLADPRTILLSQAPSQVPYYFSSFSYSLVTQQIIRKYPCPQTRVCCSLEFVQVCKCVCGEPHYVSWKARLPGEAAVRAAGAAKHGGARA